MMRYLFTVLLALVLTASMAVVPLADPYDPLGKTPTCPFTPNNISLSTESADWEGDFQK